MWVENCEFPNEALYDFENNVWIKLERNNLARLGITSIHAALAGRLIKVNHKPQGTILRFGESAATIESAKYFGAVRTPLSGRLVESNDELVHRPKLANDAPYGAGWFALIEPSQLHLELSRLRGPEGSEGKIRSLIRELRVRCFKAYPDYEMWEIGVECAAALVRLNELMEKCAVNEVVHLVSDDPTADIEMARWADQTGQVVVEERKEGKLMHVIVKKVR